MQYYSQRISPQFLRIGLKNQYVPAVKQYKEDQRGTPVKKALLLLDNASSHLGTDALVSENISCLPTQLP